MKKTIIMLLLFLVGLPIYTNAQTVYGTVIDAETLAPLPHAIVYYNGDGKVTNDKGEFELNVTTTAVLKVSLVGYESETVTLEISKDYYKILLQKQYATLTDVEVKTKRLTVNDILNKVMDSISKNYIDGGQPLYGINEIVMLRKTDTLAYITMPAYYKGKKDKWFRYNRYKQKGDTFSKYIFNNSIKQDLSDYCASFSPMFNDLRKSINALIEAKGQKVYLSTFSKSGQLYYDIVFVTVDSSEIEYSVRLKSMGYGEKNNPNAARKYLYIREYHINASNFALEYSQNLCVAGSDDEVQIFSNMTDRAILSAWTKNVNITGRKFMKNSVEFSYNSLGKLYCSKDEFFDNLIHIQYRNKNEPIKDDIGYLVRYRLQEYNGDTKDFETYYPCISIKYGL